MTLDLPGGRRLVLAGGQFGWFWLAAGAVAVVLLLVLYREERRLVSRRAGLGLLALRVLAALALVATLFEPIAARTFREAVRGRVIVAVDVSESMATADPGRTGAERAGLVKVLGMSPAEPLDAISRREVARRLLAGPLARIAAEHSVDAFAFARDTAPATLAALADTLKRPGKALDPAGQTTDWRPALAEALKADAASTSAGGSAPVIGVVLVTDGRRNGPGDDAATVDRLAARGVPVFPVLIGSTKAPRDAAIAAVKAPEAVYKGDVANVEVTLKLDGYAGREVAVTLDRPGASPLRQTAHATADGARPTVTFRVPLDEVGAVPLAVAVDPQEGDIRPDNDRKTVTVQVADDKARVLLVDGEARWEFQYLRNALARDPRVAVESIVFHQPKPGLTTTEAYTYGQTLPIKTGNEADPLGNFDAVIVGDVDPADATPEFWARLDAYVAERGGTLIVIPGPRAWSALVSTESARKLLPVLDPSPAAVDDAAEDPEHPGLPPGVPFEPTEAAVADASAWPMLQLAADPDETRRRWAGLPRLPWAIVGKTKPGATPLAISGGDPNRVILAAQPYGLGKVLWVGTDATWRWRFRVGDAYHHRFWGQVVRWAASGKLTAGNAYVRFGPVKPRSGEGESVRIQARISEGVTGIGPDLLLAARIFRAGSKPGGDAVAIVPLRPLPGQPRTFEGVAPPLPIGPYIVRLDAPGLVESLGLNPAPPTPTPEAGLEVVARDSPERVELAASRDPLDRLAAATSGTVVADFEADTLPPLLRSRSKETVRTVETPLWDSPPALLLFLTIITIEWIARKRVGLP